MSWLKQKFFKLVSFAPYFIILYILMLGIGPVKDMVLRGVAKLSDLTGKKGA